MLILDLEQYTAIIYLEARSEGTTITFLNKNFSKTP